MRILNLRLLSTTLALAAGLLSSNAQFTFTHIGTGETGSITPNAESGSFTLIGGGDDIWSATDNFDFAHETVTGDFDVRVRVESLEFVAVWTKAGLMARETLDPNSRMAFNRVTPSGGGANDTRFSYRTGRTVGTQGEHEDGSGAPGYPDAWLRLVRAGNVFTAYASTDGLNWREQGRQDTAGWEGGGVTPALQVGLGVSRHSGADPLATCEFRDFGYAPSAIAAVTTQPASQTIEEGFPATFRFSAPGGLDLYDIQWRKNGADIPGANGISYTTAALASTDTGTAYSVAIRHKGNSSTATSADAVVTVVPDTTKPSVVSLSTTPGIANRVVVDFSEPVNEADAQNVANYGLSGATASAASLQADNKTVHLTTSPLNTSGCKTLAVSGIRDRASVANTMDAYTQSFIYAEGTLRYNEYQGFGGGSVSDLTSNAKFPNNPDVTSFVTQFENPNGAAGQGDNYGARMAGYLTPAVSGEYTFYIAADDAAVLYLSTDENPANKVAIATEPIWSGFRTYTGEAGGGGRTGCATERPMCNVSLPVNLVCGNRYYVEGLWKEGGGGDHMSVAWQPPGAGVPAGPIPAQHLSPLNPVAVELGAAVPADTTISENQPLVLSINITAGTPTYHIQWFKDGAAIPGATSATFSIDNAKLSDAGTYHATIQNGLGMATSRSAVVGVIIDTIAPSMVSAIAPAGNGTQFDLIYSEPVNEADAENLANYSLPGATLNSATLQADNKTVRFTSSSLYADGCKTLTANNIRDRAIPPNTLNNGTVGVVAAKGSIRYHQYNGITGVLVPSFTSHAKFPNFPDRVLNVNQFENPEGPDDNFNDYGAQFVGFVHPPISGEYRFFVSSDDHSVLYISTDENPANKTLVASEPIWSGYRQYTGNGAGGGGRACPGPTTCNISPPIYLQAGCKYFIEHMYKEGGGGDFSSVAWQLPGGAEPAIGSAPIQATFLSPYEIPATIPAGQPADITAIQGRTVTFTANITGSPSLSVQWYRDGVAIPGATGFSLTLGPLRYPDDNGATFHVTASNGLAQVQSRTATLTVTADTDAPVVLGAAGSTTLDRVTLSFDELVDEVSAEDGFNYSVIPSGGGELGIIAVDIQADGKTAVLTLDAATPLALGTAYQVQARNVFDISGNELVEGNATFNSVIEGCGGIVFEAYNAPGNGVAALTSHPTFPNNPDFRMTIPGLDSRLAYPTDAREQYGARMRGVYVPPYSGQWVLYLRSDDASELWFNPNGIDPTGKVLVQQETGCCQAFEALPTAPMNLVGGRPYYIEVLYKEGGGGDYGQVAARPLGSADALTPIGARDVGQYAEPGFSGSLTVNGPADQTVLENRTATFSVTAESSMGLAICYQWFRDGAAIAGANGPSYAFIPTLADNGAVFTVRASIVGNVVNSAAATLNVTPDVSGPQIASATGSDSLRHVTVRFDELVDEASAEDYFNYEIAGLSVEGATLLADGQSVRLQTTEQAEGTVYTVRVNNVTDRAATPNVIAANSTVNFTSFALSRGFLSFAAYDTAATPGNAVSILTSDPDFPDNPRDRAYISSFNSRAAYPDDSHEQYGGRIHGVFIPPVSGDWIFHLRSDDASELWLNAAGNNPAGALKIAEEVGCCRNFDAIASAPQSLVAGTPYYIEGLYKEGVGGDYIQVAARLSTDTTPPNNLQTISASSLGVYAAPTGAAVNIVQHPASETSVCLNPRVAVQPNATFSVSVDVTPVGTPTTIQWQRWNGSAWIDLPATGSAYSFGPGLADNGAKFRAAIYALGAGANSGESTLSVQQMNTEPKFDVAEGHTSAEDGGTQTVPNFASNIAAHSIGRVPVVFSSDFSSAAGLQLYGVAAVRNGRLELTTPVNSVNGAAAVNAPVQTYESFEMTWKSYIGDGAGGGADGYSVNIGDNIAGDPTPTGPAEEGHPAATLSVTVDTFNNADLRNPDEGIQIEWKGQEVAFQNIPKDNPGTGNYLRKSTFVDAKLSVSGEGVATLTYDGNTITGPLAGYTGLRADRVVFWARTGGANDNQWIDDLNIQAFPFDSSSQEVGQSVVFETSNNNGALFSQQPAISADGTLSYAAAPDSNGSAVVTVVAKDDGGTACDGRDTSDPKTFTITVNGVNDCPAATPQSITVDAGVPTAIALTGTDVDGDALTASAASNPQHGTLSVVNGALTYTADAAYGGTDSFTFTVSDGTCSSAAATVTITVIPNTAPACVANVSPADCGVTFPNSGKLYTIAVASDEVCLALDGSGSSDADGDALAITWVIDETNTVSGTTASVCLPVGCHTVTMIANDGKAQCQQTIEVCVISAGEACEQLISLVESTPVERKNKRPLIVSLKAAKAAFERDGNAVGGQMLQVFRYKVAAQIARTNPGEAATFDGAAADVIQAVECSENLPPRSDE